MAKVQSNEVHALAIYRDQMRKEIDSAAEWKKNWGFLTESSPPAPRGFQQVSVKYSAGAGTYTNARKRVPDNSEEGMAAAMSEQKSRDTLSSLNWQTPPVLEVKPCVVTHKSGYTHICVPDDHSGVKDRLAVKLMLSNHSQTLGEACKIDGLDPHQKYRAPVTSAHEVGWRAPSKTNKVNSLELFGVAQHGRQDKIKTLFDMVP